MRADWCFPISIRCVFCHALHHLRAKAAKAEIEETPGLSLKQKTNKISRKNRTLQKDMVSATPTEIPSPPVSG